MKDWYTSIYKSFLISTIITFVIYFSSSGETALGALISSYVLLLISILMILISSSNTILETKQSGSMFETVLSIFLSTGPFLLMLGVIGFILYMIILYKETIATNHVSSEFYTFINLSIMLLLLNISIIYENISKSKSQENNGLSKIMSRILLLVGIIIVICSFIIYKILKYFKTDG